MTGTQHREAPEKLRHVARFRSVIPQDLLELRGEPWAAYGSMGRCHLLSATIYIYSCATQTPHLLSILVVTLW